MISVKKLENVLRKSFTDLTLKVGSVQKMNYKAGTISVVFDLELSDQAGDALVIVDKKDKHSIDVITKQYIFANKLYDELELEKKTFIVIIDSKHKDKESELIHDLEFANNYLFYNRGIKFKVLDFREFNHMIKTINTLDKFIETVRN